MEIRPARNKDWPRIIAIYNQAIDDGYCTADTEYVSLESRIDWFKIHQNELLPILVICDENGIAGWSSLSSFRPGRKALKKTVEISYYLDRDCRGKGYGKALMAGTIDAAQKLGHEYLFAILLEINAISVNLLKKFGFEQWGHMPEVADFGDRRSGLLIYGRKI